MTELEKARQLINETDKEMARLFEQRMDAVKMVAAYKKEHGLPVEDLAREKEICSVEEAVRRVTSMAAAKFA